MLFEILNTHTVGFTTLDRKRIYANPSAYLNPNPEAQLCFRTDVMMSFFDHIQSITICTIKCIHIQSSLYAQSFQV